MSIAPDGTTRRGTSNKNVSGNNEDRRRRKEWLVTTYAANAMIATLSFDGAVSVQEVLLKNVESFVAFQEEVGIVVTLESACRCYCCGELLTVSTVTVDRIIPGCHGGTYRRDNIRPACGPCNSETGGALAKGKEHQAKKVVRKSRPVS